MGAGEAGRPLVAWIVFIDIHVLPPRLWQKGPFPPTQYKGSSQDLYIAVHSC